MDRTLVGMTSRRPASPAPNPRSARGHVFALLAFVLLPVFLGGCQSSLERYRKEGVFLYQQKEYDQSLATLNKALSYDQFDAKSNAYAGLIYSRQGQFEQASYHFKLALQADPSSEEAKEGLVSTYIQMGRPDDALDALERAAKNAEQVSDPRWKKSNIKVVYDKGIDERLYLGKVEDRLRIGRTYEKLGDYDNAMTYYKKALALSPRNARVLMTISALAEKAGNKDAARIYLSRAYLVDPNTPGLAQAMTRNNLAISDVITPPPSTAPAPH